MLSFEENLRKESILNGPLAMRPEHVGGIEETDMNSFERVRA
ncbi:ribonucleotide-diphosphate reductase subunit beta, partial [Acidithiobacillus ferridurans]|nr:ribonucleotide-diphosphate reductase subunit beta [Acidithiobacillus ferridurans]